LVGVASVLPRSVKQHRQLVAVTPLLHRKGVDARSDARRKRVARRRSVALPKKTSGGGSGKACK
jgi:hypothetical protein